jgi:predicted amidohydrolase YtcJ
MQDIVTRLLDNGRFYRFDVRTRKFEPHDALLIGDDGRVLSLDVHEGPDTERVDMQGTTILPAFADCHVHLTDVGYFLGERDLSGTRSYAEFCDAVARIPEEDGVVFAGQYDESNWNDRREADARPLDRLHPGSRAMLVRVDGHSSLVNRATLEWLALDANAQGLERDADGHPTGRLSLAANWAAQKRFQNEMPLRQRREAECRAVALAVSRGALHLHAQLYGFPRDRYREEIDALAALQAKIYPKVCEPDPRLARELGLPFVGGDIFLDGSLGSRTAAQSERYADGDGCGALRFGDDEVVAFFTEAERLGVAAGVHAIGDAAIDQCVRAWERVLGGRPSRHGSRHFIEHFECARPEHIGACARMGIALSMQPQFDAQWGGTGAMYEARLGTKRMRSMNALASVVRSGALLCGGDDAPVCPLDPLGGMQACLDHHEPSERLVADEALAAYTVNAAYLAYAERETGNLDPGLCADLAVLDGDPFEMGFGACRVVQTWRDGAIVYSA